MLAVVKPAMLACMPYGERDFWEWPRVELPLAVRTPNDLRCPVETSSGPGGSARLSLETAIGGAPRYPRYPQAISRVDKCVYRVVVWPKSPLAGAGLCRSMPDIASSERTHAKASNRSRVGNFCSYHGAQCRLPGSQRRVPGCAGPRLPGARRIRPSAQDGPRTRLPRRCWRWFTSIATSRPDRLQSATELGCLMSAQALSRTGNDPGVCRTSLCRYVLQSASSGDGIDSGMTTRILYAGRRSAIK